MIDDNNKIVQVDLNIGVDQKEPYENLFQQQYAMQLHRDFVIKKESKKHNMNSHAQWTRDVIKINHESSELIEINKRKIVYVNFGMNIGTEINGIRPAIIYKHDSYRFGEDTIIIPITSYHDDVSKSVDTFDIPIDADPKNGLDHTSLIKIRQMKCISKKRLRKDKGSGKIKILGSIDDQIIRVQIDNTVKLMFGL